MAGKRKRQTQKLEPFYDGVSLHSNLYTVHETRYEFDQAGVNVVIRRSIFPNVPGQLLVCDKYNDEVLAHDDAFTGDMGAGFDRLMGSLKSSEYVDGEWLTKLMYKIIAGDFPDKWDW